MHAETKRYHHDETPIRHKNHKNTTSMGLEPTTLANLGNRKATRYLCANRPT
nr:uncharacterized protein CTRU02_10981 [Colletotrichum truncatum]KAF6786483.1 hypothetical protein CTRU02_10981 [Colletotrichum truncatum]